MLDKNSKFGDGIVGLLPSVNSDKTTVGIALFNLKASIDGTNQTYLSLKNPIEIQKLIRKELGTFYTTMYNNIKTDFNNLSSFYGITFNPDTNFAELKQYVNNYNANLVLGQAPITMEQILFEATSAYNKKNPTKPIRLIDQIHYIVSDKKGNLTFNSTIKDLLARFSDEKKTSEFFKLKSVEVLKSALDSDFNI
jgi:hypothetical protein